jgi:tRNA(Ile)-lysidine synthase
VRTLCRALNVPVTVKRIDVGALALASRGGVEEAAREARRHFLQETAQAVGAEWIALAHQRDDQAETFLLRLLRGAGTTGLAGMRPLDPPFVRPLLPFSRADIVDWLTQEGLVWRDDVSNRDYAFTRNRVRHELLPLLTSYNPAISERLAELCRQLADDEADWDARVADELARSSRPLDGALRMPCAVLTEATAAMAGRLVRAALKVVRGNLRRLDAVHVAAVLALAKGSRPQGEVHLPGAWVGRRYEAMLFRREAPQVGTIDLFEIAGPGIYPLAGGRTLNVTLSPMPTGAGRHAVEFCARAVAFPLRVRSPRPGDRLCLSAGATTKKLQDLFVDDKLPAEERASAVLVFAAEQLLWVAGLRRCAGLEPVPGAGPVLRLELVEEPILPP